MSVRFRSQSLRTEQQPTTTGWPRGHTCTGSSGSSTWPTRWRWWWTVQSQWSGKEDRTHTSKNWHAWLSSSTLMTNLEFHLKTFKQICRLPEFINWSKASSSFRTRYLPKEEIQFYNNHTVSYMLPMGAIFERDMSVGPEEDRVITLNLLLAVSRRHPAVPWFLTWLSSPANTHCTSAKTGSAS